MNKCCNLLPCLFLVGSGSYRLCRQVLSVILPFSLLVLNDMSLIEVIIREKDISFHLVSVV